DDVVLGIREAFGFDITGDEVDRDRDGGRRAARRGVGQERERRRVEAGLRERRGEGDGAATRVERLRRVDQVAPLVVDRGDDLALGRRIDLRGELGGLPRGGGRGGREGDGDAGGLARRGRHGERGERRRGEHVARASHVRLVERAFGRDADLLDAVARLVEAVLAALREDEELRVVVAVAQDRLARERDH